MDVSSILGNIRDFKENLEKMREELAREVVEGSAGGGLVRVRFNGVGEMLDMEVAPEVHDDHALLADLVRAAVNDALTRARDLEQQRLFRISGGMKFPTFT